MSHLACWLMLSVVWPRARIVSVQVSPATLPITTVHSGTRLGRNCYSSLVRIHSRPQPAAAVRPSPNISSPSAPPPVSTVIPSAILFLLRHLSLTSSSLTFSRNNPPACLSPWCHCTCTSVLFALNSRFSVVEGTHGQAKKSSTVTIRGTQSSSCRLSGVISWYSRHTKTVAFPRNEPTITKLAIHARQLSICLLAYSPSQSK